MAKRKPLSLAALKAAINSDIGNIMEIDSPTTDMATALVLCAHLEHAVMTMLDVFFVEIKCGLCDECKKGIKCKKNNEIFSIKGTLESFSKCCDLALRVGLINQRLRDNLKYIGNIRNCFAHSPLPLDFNDAEIVIYCNNLAIPQVSEEARWFVESTSPKWHFITIASLMLFHFEDFTPSINKTDEYTWPLWS
jgi:hypothetical protein